MAIKLNASNALELNKLVQYSTAQVSEVLELVSNYIFVFNSSSKGPNFYKAVVKKEESIKKWLEENRLIDSIFSIINNIETIKVDEHEINCIVLLPYFGLFSTTLPEKLHLGLSKTLTPMLEYYKELKVEDDILKCEILKYDLKNGGSYDMLTLKMSNASVSYDVSFLVDNYHVILFPEFEELSTYDQGELKDLIDFIKTIYKRVEFFKSKVKKELYKKHKINCFDETEFWQTDIHQEMEDIMFSWINSNKEDISKTKKIFTASGLKFLSERLKISPTSFLTVQELEKKKKELLDSENYEEISKLK